MKCVRPSVHLAFTSSPIPVDVSICNNEQKRACCIGTRRKLIEEVDEPFGVSQALCSAAPEMTRSSNQSNTICGSAIARNNDVETIVVTPCETFCETFCSSDSTDYDITRKHARLSQARSTEHFVPGIDPDNDIDSIFGDISYIFDEQDDGVTIEDHQIDRSEASLQHGEELTHHCEHLSVAEDEGLKNEVCSVGRQGVKRQADSAQKQDQILYSMSPDNVEGETSDETDTESVFDNRLHKKRRYSSPPSSSNSSDLFTEHLSRCSQLNNKTIFDRPYQGTIIERGHDDNPIVVGDFGNEYTSQ